MTGVPLVWDLLDEDDAGLFLGPIGAPAALAYPHLPCRALRLPLAASTAADPSRWLMGASGLACCGTDAALDAAARALDPPWRDGALQALANFRVIPPALRLADGRLLSFDTRPRVMGVLNVTPDSFFDGGSWATPQAAIDRALQLADEGADLVDIGGESTRPGATPVDETEELRRVAPVLGAIKRARPSLLLSIDTRHHEVARRALELGADLLNDVSALVDPRTSLLAAERGVPVCLMHMRGEPATMQQSTEYHDLLGEIAGFLAARAAAARAAGIAGDRLLLDPGFGFGKSSAGNELLLRQLAALTSLGPPVMVGLSRKRFIGERTLVQSPAERRSGSLAGAVLAAERGAALVRVHDVRATREALALAGAMRPVGAVKGG